jgi:hypothetical protein
VASSCQNAAWCRGQVLKDPQDIQSARLMPCNVLDFELEMVR